MNGPYEAERSSRPSYMIFLTEAPKSLSNLLQ